MVGILNNRSVDMAKASYCSETSRIVAHVDIEILKRLLLYTDARRLNGLSNGRIVGVALRELFDLIDLDKIAPRPSVEKAAA